MSARERDSSERDPDKSMGPFARLSLFVSQILDELRKVVRPTRSELRNYTVAVIAFVTVMMFFIFGLDWVFSRLVNFIFGAS
ncbi:MAG: preprotein translocase subunit SecE [Dermatophilaceae bacterium]